MASNKEEQKTKDDSKSKYSAIKDLIDNEECVLRKRLPRKLPKRDCDVYVTRKTDFKQQLKRCQKILDHGNLVCIHGLGTAINRAINLGLQLRDGGMGTVEVSVHTSTVELTDDIEPLTDERDADTLSRNNSAVHIRVFRPDAENPSKQIDNIEKDLKS
ncbi:ribonuclease P protein subunit p20-like [Mercenaria mercenaria]|uniref:ribonuclease P protein subunit p20-like n=1 Tax=Mercenaria mercenaria TaxID=6596 RepID=UPI00234E586F|nr:ribonuclease P protein subunit p20-like [Mercenaria mercenaria]